MHRKVGKERHMIAYMIVYVRYPLGLLPSMRKKRLILHGEDSFSVPNEDEGEGEGGVLKPCTASSSQQARNHHILKIGENWIFRGIWVFFFFFLPLETILVLELKCTMVVE